MSRYVTWEDLVRRYPAAAKASADDDMTQAIIDPAEAEVDMRLAKVTTTPFTAPIPDIVKSLSIDVAYYKLKIFSKEAEPLGRYLYGTDGKSGIFGQIVDGTVIVDATSTPNAAWIDAEYTSRFGPDDPINWEPDPDSYTDAEGARR
jgi:hypothetical protein